MSLDETPADRRNRGEIRTRRIERAKAAQRRSEQVRIRFSGENGDPRSVL